MSTKNTNEKPRIGITIGDLNGIGPEIIIKTLSDTRIVDMLIPVVFGSSRVLSFYKKVLEANEFQYTNVKATGQFQFNSTNVVNCWEDVISITPGLPSKESGKASYLAIREAVQQLKDGVIDALVTSPIDKHSIQSDEFPFKGHTDFLTSFFSVKDSLMLLVSDRMRVALVTEHLPLSEAVQAITPGRIESKISLLEGSLKSDFGISRPRIAVLGLNPHAGDQGVIGREDEDIIKPVLSEFKNKGGLVYGPFPADGFFGMAMQYKYDAVLAMYHDQGLVPFKALAFTEGVNFTAGLPVIRTSPDHGTAYSIAGKNQADESSFRNALFLASMLYKKRHELAAA